MRTREELKKCGLCLDARHCCTERKQFTKNGAECRLWALDAKAWLNRGRGVMLEIDTLRAAKREAESWATNMTVRAAHDGVKSGDNLTGGVPASGRAVEGYTSRGDDMLFLVLKYEETLDNRIAELGAVLNEISRAIYAVDDGTLRVLLINRYILFKKWEQVAVDMGYSYANITIKLHPKALNAVKKYIEV